MADTTKIEWTDATWNIITGCSMVDAGCTNCYAMTLAASRLTNHPSREGLTRESGGRHVWTGETRLNEQWLDQPLKWKRGRMIFVCAHGDLFHESVPDEWIDKVFAVMALAPQHTFQVLTKRPDRAARYLNLLLAMTGAGIQSRFVEAGRKAGGLIGDMPDLRRRITALPLRNVWLGTSISDQASANARVPQLLAAPAEVLFLSVEPMLGPIDLEQVNTDNLGNGFAELAGTPALSVINWVIVGGESGKNARPMHPDWARSLRDQCQAAGVAFFFKQWGEWLPLGQGGFTRWEAACAANGNRVDKRKPYSIGVCCFNDGRGGPETHSSGPVQTNHSLLTPGKFSAATVARIGKARAGRMLDGVEWSQMPERGQS